MNINGKKIIIHNLTFRGIEAVPGILDFDQRGVVCANNGDICVTKTPIEPEYLSYLENLGWNFEQCQFLNPGNQKNYSYNSVFNDPKIISSTKQSGYYLDTYNSTDEENRFSKKIGAPIYGHSKLSEKFGTKSGFRKLARKLELNMADGFEGIRTPEKLEGAINELFEIGKKELVVKIDEGISGAGATKISLEDWQGQNKKEREEFLEKSLFKIKQTQENSGVVAEEWLQNVIASPSIQIQVFPDKSWKPGSETSVASQEVKVQRVPLRGTKSEATKLLLPGSQSVPQNWTSRSSTSWKIVSMHDQLLEGEEKWYVGCQFPQTALRGKLLKKALKDAKKFTGYLISEGFSGFFGLDLILASDKQYYWVEANMRKPGTFYPRIIAEKLNNGSLKGIFYVASDFTAAKFKGIPFSGLKTKFQKFLYPINGKKEGVVLYNIGALKDAGRFDAVCIGKTGKTAKNIYSSFKKKVREQDSNPYRV